MSTAALPLDGGFRKFIQFQKLEDEKDGAPTVWGIATQQEPDLDGEICDYATAVEAYKAWSSAAAKRTQRAGQAISFGNIRLQHGLDIGGKATKLEFDDAAKQVWLGSEPINDQIKSDLKEGFYTGYSQGGSYAWRRCVLCESDLPLRQAYNFCEQCNKTVKVLYGLKKIAEVSYVDSPCSGEGFEHVKANGSREIVKFARRSEDDMPQLTPEQLEALDTLVSKRKKETKTKRVAGEDLPHDCFAYVGDPEKTETWKLPIKFSSEEKTKRHIRNALARFDQTKGIPDDKKEEVKAKIHAAAKEHDIDVAEEGDKTESIRDQVKATVKAIIAKRVGSEDLAKGLYEVGRFAEWLESLSWMYVSSIYERDMEGDDSPIPEDIEEILHDSIEVFIAMATEEATELAARTVGKTTGGNNSMTPEEQEALNKAAKKSLAHHFAKSAAHHEKLEAAHTKKAEHHEKAMEKCKTIKADVGSGTEHSAIHSVLENQQDFHKGMASEHMKVAKSHGKHAEHLHKMSEESDAEEHEKTVKAIKAEAPEPEAPVKKAEPAVADADAEFARKAREKADADLLADSEFMDEVKKTRRENLLKQLASVDEEVKTEKAKRQIPDGVDISEVLKAQGLKIAPHDTSAFKFAEGVASNTASTGGI